jgi:hypothetical protein
LTAFASIPAPHDAFQKTFNVLVAAPGIYTFVRPVGDRRFLTTAKVNPHSQSAPAHANQGQPLQHP